MIAHGSSVAFVEIATYPSGMQAMNAVAYAGYLKDRVVIFQRIIDMGRSLGVPKLMFIGRPGWAEVMKALGLNKVAVVYSVDID